MSGAEERVRDAFGRIRAPEGLVERTLAAVERERALGPAAPAPAPGDGRAPRRGRRAPARLAAAACLALALLGAGGTYAVATPTAYVDIEVNPAIELAVNRFDRVVGARALNEDGEEVLAGIDVAWETCSDALDDIGGELEALGYLEGGATVDVTVACDDEGQYDSIESACRERLGGYADEVSCAHERERSRSRAHGEHVPHEGRARHGG